MSNSEKILERLQFLHPKQIDLTLDRTRELLDKLNNPQFNLPKTIHVAGTNGKGSTLAFLRGMLEMNGYKTHVYTSPHLINFNERIRLNSKIISNKFLLELLKECEFYNKKKAITFFEITTVAAILAFSRVKSDYLLLETGLGGKYDATNVIEKKVCTILTPISMDHMSFLGNSIEGITKEKIGILKKNVPAVIAKQTKKVTSVIRNFTNKNLIKSYFYDADWKIEKINKVESYFSLKFENTSFNLPLPGLNGDHQIMNSGLAFTVINVLKNLQTSHYKTSQAIKNVDWPARMQRINSGPFNRLVSNKMEIWLDGGHNVDASKILSNILNGWETSNKFLIFGMVQGKDFKKFLKNISYSFKCIIVIPIVKHQYISPEIIKKDLDTSRSNVFIKQDIKDALTFLNLKYKQGKILICGSLYLAGSFLKENNFKIN